MTLYQKVRKALEAKGATTYPNLADLIDADEEAVRQELQELKRRGKARSTRHYDMRAEIWEPSR